MSELPDRFCEICGAIHKAPIHDLSSCYPGQHGGKLYFSRLADGAEWPTKEEIEAGVAYWDVVLSDKGTKPLS